MQQRGCSRANGLKGACCPGRAFTGYCSLCYSGPFGPVNLVTPMVCLFCLKEQEENPLLLQACGQLDQTQQQLPVSQWLFPSQLPKAPILASTAASGSHSQVKAHGEKLSPVGLFQDKTATGVIVDVSIYHLCIWVTNGVTAAEYPQNPLKQRSLSQLALTGSGSYVHSTKCTCSHKLSCF